MVILTIICIALGIHSAILLFANAELKKDLHTMEQINDELFSENKLLESKIQKNELIRDQIQSYNLPH